MVKYIALFETDAEADGVGVIFPDIPECVSSGRDFNEAYKNAHEILTYVLEDKESRGEKIPQPRTLEQIKKEWKDWAEWKNNYDFVVGAVSYFPPCKPKKYTLYLDSALVARIDEVTKNRSAFLSEAAKAMLDGKLAPETN